MKAFELINLIREATQKDGTAGSDIMIISQRTGKLLCPQVVQVEHYESGRSTVWIEAEEF